MATPYALDVEKVFDALQLWVTETQARVEELEREVYRLREDAVGAAEHVPTREGDTPAARCNAFAEAEETLRAREAVRSYEREDWEIIRDATEKEIAFEAAAVRIRQEQEAKRRRRDD